MDFCSFISIAGDIVFPLSKERFQKSRILGNRFKFSQNTEKDKRDAIRLCFQTLFTNQYKLSTTEVWTNDFFLDWSTPTSSLENHPPGVIKILGGENGEKNYLFLASEIFSIFHNDLSRSSAEIENQYGICTVSKAFRLPHNPYSNLAFSSKEIRDILSQILLQSEENVPPYKEMPEIYHYFANFQEIHSQCKNLTGYHTTDFLHSFFQKCGLDFVEKTRIKTRTYCENRSTWLVKNKKNSPLDFHTLLFHNRIKKN
jgi:hypothetical protein